MSIPPEHAKVREFILEWQKKHGRRPTYQEIADGIGIGTTAVCKHVNRLEKLGELVLLYVPRDASAKG